MKHTDPDGLAPVDITENCCLGMDVKFRVNATGITRDAEEYAHQMMQQDINWWNKNQKGAVPFDGGIDQAKRIVDNEIIR